MRIPVVRRLAPGLVGAAAVLFANCGGDNGVTPNPRPTVAPTPTTATATPTTAPTAEPTSPAGCAFAPGPVTRYAIAPRYQWRLPGAVLDQPMKVRVVTPFEEEIWCIDKDKDWRLEFNSNQRNADGKESCWEGEPQWTIVKDTHSIVEALGPWGGGFQSRLRVRPSGIAGAYFEIEAELDGIKSHPWQSGSFYSPGPLKVLAMSAANIAAKCQCNYYGNGVYEHNGTLDCPKIR
jgi:hypothetical protein